jgi:hypothetical protein
MTTPKQAEANRRNARRSTGPKTPEGKARSRRNAVKHGATALDLMLLPGEDPDKFRGCIEAIHETYKPVGNYEFGLVQRIAFMEWRLSRLSRFEVGMMQAGFDQLSQTESEVGENENQDCPTEASPDVLDLENDLAQITRLLSESLESKLPQLNLLARYEVTLQRNIERTYKMLERVQSLRRARKSTQATSTARDWSQMEAFMRADAKRSAETLDTIDEEARWRMERDRMTVERKKTPTTHPQARETIPAMPTAPEISNDPRAREEDEIAAAYESLTRPMKEILENNGGTVSGTQSDPDGRRGLNDPGDPAPDAL